MAVCSCAVDRTCLDRLLAPSVPVSWAFQPANYAAENGGIGGRQDAVADCGSGCCRVCNDFCGAQWPLCVEPDGGAYRHRRSVPRQTRQYWQELPLRWSLAPSSNPCGRNPCQGKAGSVLLSGGPSVTWTLRLYRPLCEPRRAVKGTGCLCRPTGPAANLCQVRSHRLPRPHAQVRTLQLQVLLT